MSKKLTSWTCFSIVFHFICGMNAWCETHTSNSEQFDYPELSMVPRASARLQTEAESEPDRKLTTFVPIQISAAATLTAGLLSTDAALSSSGIVGIAVGGTWLITSTIMAFAYHPYAGAWSDVSPLPKGSVREQLTRERVAEEAIRRASSFGEKLRWLSFITNLGAAGYMLSRGNGSGTSSTGTVIPPNYAAMAAQATAAAFSLFPIIFRFHWHDVAEAQSDYKKRVYAPVANATILVDPATGKYVPGINMSMSF